jgi:Ran GTPase-activating protein (RanGAP) involved in mRNA processing and transport
LASFPRLVSLALTEHNCYSAYSESLFKCMVKNLVYLDKLQYLDLGNNHFGNRGATALAEVLPALTGLLSLGINSNCISSVGCVVLFPAMKCLTRLTTFNFCDNLINSELCSLFAETLGEIKVSALS